MHSDNTKTQEKLYVYILGFCYHLSECVFPYKKYWQWLNLKNVGFFYKYNY